MDSRGHITPLASERCPWGGKMGAHMGGMKCARLKRPLRSRHENIWLSATNLPQDHVGARRRAEPASAKRIETIPNDDIGPLRRWAVRLLFILPPFPNGGRAGIQVRGKHRLATVTLRWPIAEAQKRHAGGRCGRSRGARTVRLTQQVRIGRRRVRGDEVTLR